MKKTLLSLVSLAMALLLVAGCSSSKKSEKQVHIGILQYVEHESLTAARKGFENELKDQGYIDGKNIKIDYRMPKGTSPISRRFLRAYFLRMTWF